MRWNGQLIFDDTAVNTSRTFIALVVLERLHPCESGCARDKLMGEMSFMVVASVVVRGVTRRLAFIYESQCHPMNNLRRRCASKGGYRLSTH